MYIPSSIISRLISFEKYGVWAEAYGNSLNSALIVKLPSNVIKAIVQGCKIELVIGVVLKDESSSYLAIGVSVFDSPGSPFLAVMSPRLREEKDGILNLLKKGSFSISLYDEMDYPVCSAKGKISRFFFRIY